MPFVLRFVQQALRLLWDGLDKVQPHKSVGEDLWKDVAPADLGEMAADVEMQQHFMIKKRPHTAIENAPAQTDPTDSDLAMGFDSLGTPSGFQPVRSIYTGQGTSAAYDDEGTSAAYDDDFEPNVVPLYFQQIQEVQSHVQQAVQSVANVKPMHQHVSTNEQGSKRAHLFIERLDSPVDLGATETKPQESSTETSRERGCMEAPSPLPMPRPLPLPNATLRQPPTGSHSTNSPQIHPMQSHSARQQGQNIYSSHLDQSQKYQVQNPQQPQMLVFFTQPNRNNERNSGNVPFATQIQMQAGQPSHQQQDTYMGFSTVQSSNQIPFEMSYPNQQQDMNNMGYDAQQQHQQQHQQQYQTLQSTEALSLPPEFNQASNFHTQQNSISSNHMQQGGIPSVPNNKISSTGMVFPMPPTNTGQMDGLSHQNGVGQVAGNRMAAAPNGGEYCMTVNQGGSSSQTNAKVCNDTSGLWSRLALSTLTLSCCNVIFTFSLVAFKGVTNLQLPADRTALDTAGIECARMQGAQSVRRAQLGSASRTAEAVVAHFRDVTRAPGTSSSVQLTEAASDVNLMAAINRQLVGPSAVLPMGEAEDAPLTDVINLRSRLRNSVSNTAGAKNVYWKTATRLHVVVRNIVLLTVAEFGANWQVATVSLLVKSNSAEHTEGAPALGAPARREGTRPFRAHPMDFSTTTSTTKTTAFLDLLIWQAYRLIAGRFTMNINI